MATEKIQTIAQALYDYLKQNCVGKQTCTSDALLEAFPDGFIIDSIDTIWEVHDELWRIVNKERRFVLDPGENTDCHLGLPYNFPFYFRPRWAKSPAWKIRIPYFNSGEEYYQWISHLPEWSLPEPYESYFKGLYRSTLFSGYEHHIDKHIMMKALKRSQRTGQMIVIVPDEEFLPGGLGEGQCDGWTYHLEFISMRDYFSQEYERRTCMGESLPPKEEWVDLLVNFPNDI